MAKHTVAPCNVDVKGNKITFTFDLTDVEGRMSSTGKTKLYVSEQNRYVNTPLGELKFGINGMKRV